MFYFVPVRNIQTNVQMRTAGPTTKGEACCARRFSKKNPPLATGASLGRRRHRKSIRGSAVSRNSHTDRETHSGPSESRAARHEVTWPLHHSRKAAGAGSVRPLVSVTPLRSKRTRTPSVLSCTCNRRVSSFLPGLSLWDGLRTQRYVNFLGGASGARAAEELRRRLSWPHRAMA